jgi:hypothetical protein
MPEVKRLSRRIVPDAVGRRKMDVRKAPCGLDSAASSMPYFP